ncbi:MAG: hypothetical protein WA981_11210 [Glaciecola sp.]
MSMLINWRTRLLLVIACTGVFACSQQNQASAPILYSQYDVTEFEQAANNLFVLQSVSVSEYAASLNTLLTAQKERQMVSVKSINKSITFSPWLTTALLSKQVKGDLAEQAKQDAHMRRLKMRLLHQLHIASPPYLHPQDQSRLQTDSLNAYYESLQALHNAHNILLSHAIEIYEASDDTQLFAYQMRINDKRAYVAYNFSFDIHTMPLPFGFMASTKVLMWQSDAQGVDEFVTSTPLMIRPLTAVIIIVG